MAAANLSIYSKSLAFTDTTASNAPVRKAWDLTSNLQNIPVKNPLSQSFVLAPGASQTIINSTRATSISGTTAFTVTLSPIDNTRYRFTNVAGTAPAFRTDRALTLSGSTVTMVKNQNGSATMTISAGSFAAVVVGDTVFIPGLTTGDTAGPFNALNEGFWVVIGKLSNTSLTLTRLAGVTFQAASEAPVLTANSQLQAFSATGVQLGDAVSISAGFSTTTQSTYAVYTVTPGWFEVLASRALPLETSIIPGTTGMLFYSAAKRFVRLETDQPCIIQFNGDTGTTGQLAPWSAGDPTLVAWSERVGPTFQVTVVSASLVPANITFVSAE